MPLDRACEELIRGGVIWVAERQSGSLPSDFLDDGSSPPGKNRRGRGERAIRSAGNNAPLFPVDGTTLFLLFLRSSPEGSRHRRGSRRTRPQPPFPPARLYSGTRMSPAGRSRSWGTDRYGRALAPRKVRAPQGRLPGNAWVRAARASRNGQCNRKQTAVLARGR